MFERASFMARARQGSDRSQAEAARQLRLSRATINNYESGHVEPSEPKKWELLAGLALGEPTPGERPKLLVSFALLGQRFASRRGGLLAFGEIAHAQWFADALENCQLDRIVIVPVWPSRVRELLEREGSRIGGAELVVYEELALTLDELLADVQAELFVRASDWLRESLTVWTSNIASGAPRVDRAAA
jgi:transcriptional regulator with XRE-family HTH domain